MLTFLRPGTSHLTEEPPSHLQNEGFELDQWFLNFSSLTLLLNQTVLKLTKKYIKFMKQIKRGAA